MREQYQPGLCPRAHWRTGDLSDEAKLRYSGYGPLEMLLAKGFGRDRRLSAMGVPLTMALPQLKMASPKEKNARQTLPKRSTAT